MILVFSNMQTLFTFDHPNQFLFELCVIIVCIAIPLCYCSLNKQNTNHLTQQITYNRVTNTHRRPVSKRIYQTAHADTPVKHGQGHYIPKAKPFQIFFY